MNMIVEFDRASSALSKALSSKEVSVVVQSRDDLKLIQVRAKQIKDRKLLADAMEFQMRVERWLGVLLEEATAAGVLASPGRQAKSSDRWVTLPEIGVTGKLSAKAKAMAALNENAFNVVIREMRDRIAAGKAKIVDTGRQVDRAILRNRRKQQVLMVDGKSLADLKIGKLRSRIEQLSFELRLLKAVVSRIGAENDALATIGDVLSEVSIYQLIEEAKETEH